MLRNETTYTNDSVNVGAKGGKMAQNAHFVNDNFLSMFNAKPLLRGGPWGAPEPFQAQQNRF